LGGSHCWNITSGEGYGDLANKALFRTIPTEVAYASGASATQEFGRSVAEQFLGICGPCLELLYLFTNLLSSLIEEEI